MTHDPDRNVMMAAGGFLTADTGWQLMEACPYRDDTELLSYTDWGDGMGSYDIITYGWEEDDKPVWFNGDCVVTPTHWRLPPARP